MPGEPRIETMGWHQGELPAGWRRYSFPEPECYLHETCTVLGRVKIGRFTYISDYSNIAALSPVTIGSFCSIAPGFQCATHEEPPSELVTGFPIAEVLGMDLQRGGVTGRHFVSLPLPDKPISIGNDVWIGDHVTVIGGVTIGDGCVIGAKSVVREDCVPYGVYAGNPARLVRMRFPDNVVTTLLVLKWWDWSVEQIQANARFFDTDLKDLNDLLAA